MPALEKTVPGKELMTGALLQAAQGYKIFPQNGKISRIKDWPNAASSDYEVIKNWWRNWPGANIGCATGRASNVIVLDVDVKNGNPGDESLARLRQAVNFPTTLKHSTPSGGTHIFFKYPAGMDRIKNFTELPGYPGIELKADGGAITMAPSPGYKVISQVTVPAPCPSWLLQMIKSKEGNLANDTRKAIGEGSEVVPEGMRNNYLTQLAGKLRNIGFDYNEIVLNLLHMNRERCQPQLPEDEVRNIAKSVCRYAPGEAKKTTRKPAYNLDSLIEAQPLATPDAGLKKEILKILLEVNNIPIEIKRMQAGNVLLEWMKQNGFFLQSTQGVLYYFYHIKKKLYLVEHKDFRNLLFIITGCEPAGKNFTYFYDCCQTVASQAEKKEVVKVTYWNKQTNVLYISKFNGMVLKLDGETIEEIPNGRDVIFEDEASWKTYEPDFSGGKVIDELAYDLPNWAGDKDLSGTAFKAWIMSTFFIDLCPTRPLLVMLGEKGSGKTMTLRMYLRLLFGPEEEVSGVPNKPDGFIAAASSHYIMVLDNLDNPVNWLRDKLARLATGAVDEYRKLYTSNELGKIKYRCWLACTSRTPDTLRRDDLADRLLILKVKGINPEIMMAERHFLDMVEEKRNLWWGSVVQTLNRVVAAIRMGYLSDNASLRMGDWESLGRVITFADGREDEWSDFLTRLKSAQSELLLEDEPICEGIEKWLEDGNNYDRRIVARELYGEFTNALFGSRSPTGWYKSLHTFSRKLSQLRKDLAKRYGMRWEKGTDRKTHNKMVYWFEWFP